MKIRYLGLSNNIKVYSRSKSWECWSILLLSLLVNTGFYVLIVREECVVSLDVLTFDVFFADSFADIIGTCINYAHY